MNVPSSLPSKMLLPLVIVTLANASASGAVLMNMTFDNGGSDINETAGWNGTTATGGSLAAGLTIASGMTAYGDFTAQNHTNSFHLDNWHTTNSAATRVGITVSASPGYSFSLGGGSETFSTRLHQHPSSAPDIFNAVELYINGSLISSQSYTPGATPQTLTWGIGTNPLLNNLTSATFDLKFVGVVDPVNNNHGPEWSVEHGSFVSFTGTAIPEASQVLLACLGMGLGLIRRRR